MKLNESITSKHTDEEKQKLQEIADSLDMSLSKYVRTITKNAVDQYENYGVFQPMCQVSAKDTVDTKVSLFKFLGIEIVLDVKKAQQLRPVELLASAFQKNTNMNNQIIAQAEPNNTVVQI